jgi:hypothetical protein
MILECLKKCLDNFNGHNIEIITHLLETSGKYLIKMEESKLKFNNLLDFLWRMKESNFGSLFITYTIEENISSKAMTNLESAYYLCRAP